MAKWKRALEELDSNGFVRALGPKRTMFEVTDRGYELADRLNAAGLN
jgi:predicted transcriptional regulator